MEYIFIPTLLHIHCLYDNYWRWLIIYILSILMKQFIANVLRITILSFICFITIDVCILFYKDEKSLYSHEKNVLLAYNTLKALQDTTKIVIIAGSNGGFSINSRMISNAFHMPVVNTSTHAGIGVRMQFEIYKDLLHKGDVIIFCPEYGNGKNRLYGETTLLRILSTQLPSAYKKLSARQWLFIHKYIGLYFNGICKHFGQKPFDGPYSVKALNEYGDIEWERPHQDSSTITNMCINIHMTKVLNCCSFLRPLWRRHTNWMRCRLTLCNNV